jgi:competence protein ComEC
MSAATIARPTTAARPHFPGSIRHAPLGPFALAVTAGIVADRCISIPLELSRLLFIASLILAIAALAGWFVAQRDPHSRLPLVYLIVAATSVGAAWHHRQRDVYDDDDIGDYTEKEAQIVRLRGVLDEEPTIIWQPRQRELRTIPSDTDPTIAVLEAKQLWRGEDWITVSGRVQLVVTVHLVGFHAGDEIEVIGHLSKPNEPANPGEFNQADHLLDQHIRARVVVLKTADAVERINEGWTRSPSGWLAVLRGWGQRTLGESLPHRGGLAMALLLGDGGTMTSSDWEKYVRTGVIHVLAISGQHLVVLAFFLWFIVRLSGVRRRWAALGIAGFLLLYSLLVGGRPPVMRSAATVCVAAGGLLLRRPGVPANTFALAWLTVAVLNPTDIFNAGCQLSFLSVAILYWGASRWFRQELDPLERLVEQTRPGWERIVRGILREIVVAYLIGLAIWLALIPLVAYRYHMVTFSGLLIGPPLVLLTSIALITGFLTLACAATLPFLVPLFAYPTDWSLGGCEFLVDLCDHMSWARLYVADVPEWLLWIFYPALLSVLMLEPLYRHRRWAVTAAAAWFCVWLLSGATRPTLDEMRCTFLAVGHGGCTVIETPDGRTLLYDAGAVSGPDVTRRIIAPYLWNRGIRRIDAVFLSHADLDHFNGLPALLERFSVKRIIRTPSFADKHISGVRYTLEAIESRKIPVEIATVGDLFAFGEVSLEVLHPPAEGPSGNENARSMVMLVRHAGNQILFTGDLELEGMQQVLKKKAPHIDILMAPHHGSLIANSPEFAAWADARYVISCQEPPRGPSRRRNPYPERGGKFLPTWSEGAVTIHSNRESLRIECFLSKQRFVVDRPAGP